MTTQPTSTRKRKVCMSTYTETYMPVPPMFNEGVSLARAGFEVESFGLAPMSGSGSTDEHVPGFSTRRFPVRARNFFHARFGHAVRGRGFPIVQYLLSYAEFVAKTATRAWRSRADLYEAHDLPALPPMMVAAKLRGRPISYHAHELWSEASAEDRFARFWRLLDRALVPHCDRLAAARRRIVRASSGRNSGPGSRR